MEALMLIYIILFLAMTLFIALIPTMGSGLVACSHCGNPIAFNAYRCLYCGGGTSYGSDRIWDRIGIWIIISIIVFFVVYGSL